MSLYIAMSTWVFMLAATKPNTIVSNRYTATFIFWSFFLLVTILVMLNYNKLLVGPEAISDLRIYTREFAWYSDLSFEESLSVGGKEWLFTLFTWILSQITENIYVYLTIVWLSITFILVRSLRLIFEPWKVVLVFFTYVNYPFFLSYVFNGMRQGFAMTFLLLALCLLVANKKSRFLFYGCVLSAFLFHASTLPFALALILLRKMKRLSLKTSVSIWVMSALLFVTGLNRLLLAPVAARIESLSGYLQDVVLAGYSGVNRLDFLLFSFVFIALGIFLYKRTAAQYQHKYRLILNAYILYNVVFVLFGFIAFSNRLSAFSWFLIPLLIWYPVLSIEKTKRPNSLIVLLILISSVAIGSATGVPKFFF